MSESPKRIWIALILWIIVVLLAVYAWDTFIGSGTLFTGNPDQGVPGPTTP